MSGDFKRFPWINSDFWTFCYDHTFPAPYVHMVCMYVQGHLFSHTTHSVTYCGHITYTLGAGAQTTDLWYFLRYYGRN